MSEEGFPDFSGFIRFYPDFNFLSQFFFFLVPIFENSQGQCPRNPIFLLLYTSDFSGDLDLGRLELKKFPAKLTFDSQTSNLFLLNLELQSNIQPKSHILKSVEFNCSSATFTCN